MKNKLLILFYILVFALTTFAIEVFVVPPGTPGVNPNPNSPTNWSVAVTNIADALSCFPSMTEKTIYVSNGLYEISQTLVFPSDKAVVMRSFRNGELDPSNTIIKGTSTNRCIFLTGSELSSNMIVGFTIQNGLASNAPGGGIYIENGIVSNCFVIANTAMQANSFGGGIYINGTGIVVNSVIAQNVATNCGGGIALATGATAVISNCLIVSNYADSKGPFNGGGGGIYVSVNTRGILVDSIIQNNSASNGGGVLLHCNSTNFIIDRCVFFNNLSIYTNGAAIAAFSNFFGPVRNSLFYNNTNAALRISAAGTIENCTIVTNSIGVRIWGGQVNFVNTIIYHNLVANRLYNSGSDSYTNCCIFPTNNLTGTNNIMSDPSFVSVSSYKFRLLPNSPCIDAGTTNGLGWLSGALDLMGMPRVVGVGGNKPDIGAYEYPHFAFAITPLVHTNFIFEGSSSTGMPYGIYNNSENESGVSFPVPVSVVVTSDVNWTLFSFTNFDIPPSGGVITNFVTNNPVGIQGGVYTGTFVVFPQNPQLLDYRGHSCTGKMVLQVMRLSTYPGSFSNFIAEGQDLPNQSFNLYSTGMGSFAYSISIEGGAGWVNSVQLNGGMTNNATNTIELMYNVSELDAGFYTTAVLIASSQGGGTTQRVPISVSVAGTEILPSGFTNRVIRGHNATNQFINIRAKGGVPLNYNITSNIISGSNWLSVLPVSGYSTGEYDVVTNIYYTATLTAGWYSASVKIVSTNTAGIAITNTIPISLQVMEQASLKTSTNSLYQEIKKGQNPSNLFFEIWNGNGGMAVPMGYHITVSNDSVSPILQNVSPYNGFSTGDIDNIFVYFNDLSAFSEGIYTGIVQVVATNYGSGYAGTWQAITSIVVRIAILAPSAPHNVYASQGTYDNGVAISWSPVVAPLGGSISYEVLRYISFVSNYADVIASGLTTTNFYDTTALPGKLYYYWVRTVNEHLQPGPLSQYVIGYRALEPPSAVFATDAAYSNKVVVTWTETDGASSYYVGRKVSGSTVTVEVYHASGNTFEDYPVIPGVVYTYYVKSTNSLCGSRWSSGDSGYALGAPTAVLASDGVYNGLVRISWNASSGATSYEIWRNIRPQAPPSAGSIKIGETSLTSFDDTTGMKGVTYYYWVKAKNEYTESGLSSYDTGYSAIGNADLSVSMFVVHPGSFVLSGYPVVASLRVSNAGPTSLAISNRTLKVELYYSTSIIFGDGNEVLLGTFTTEPSLPVGGITIVNIPPLYLRMPDEPGNYYLYARVIPTYPSLIADPNLANNFTRRVNRIKVDPQPQVQTYRAFNDYNGDGISDLVSYKDGLWTAKTCDGIIIGVLNFGSASEIPVCGDYDGDLKSDPVLYNPNTGLWRGMLSSQSYKEKSGVFELGANKLPVGDYNGDGKTDISWYNSMLGGWYIYSISSGWLVRNLSWGGSSFVPVIGDFDGDGKWDIAVYNSSTGRWYIRRVSGEIILFDVAYSPANSIPVAGDYDGDGIWDLAVYQQSTGKWYIKTTTGRTLASGLVWGDANSIPVTGDFNGDGAYDLAVFNSNTGYGKIRSLSGTIIMPYGLWSIPGSKPVAP